MNEQQKLYEFPIEWRRDGKLYGSEIVATSKEEAEAHLEATAHNGKVIGGPVHYVPAWPGNGIYFRFVVWWLNLKRRLLGKGS